MQYFGKKFPKLVIASAKASVYDKDLHPDLMKSLEMFNFPFAFVQFSLDEAADFVTQVTNELKPSFVVLLGEVSDWMGLNQISEIGGIRYFPCPSLDELDQKQTAIIAIFLQVKELLISKMSEKKNYTFLYRVREIRDFIQWAASVPEWSIDLESNKVPPYHKKFCIYSFAFSSSPGVSYGFGLCHPQAELRRYRKYYSVWSELASLFQNPNICWVGHNILKFDKPGIEIFFKIKMVKDYLDFWNRFHDTMAMKYTLNESAKGKYKLKTCAYEEMGWPNWGIDTSDLSKEPLDKVLHYNCQDTDAVSHLKQIYFAKMDEFTSFYGVNLRELYFNEILRNALNAAGIDGAGAKGNIAYAEQLNIENVITIEELTKGLKLFPEIQQLELSRKTEYLKNRKKLPLQGSEKWKEMEANMEKWFSFDPGSTKSMKEVLYGIMKLPYPEEFGRTEKTGDVRVTEEVLKHFEENGVEIAKFLRIIAEKSRLQSNYVLPLLRHKDMTYDGLSHTSTSYTHVETGRYSMKNADENSETETDVGENLQKIEKSPEVQGLYTTRF